MSDFIKMAAFTYPAEIAVLKLVLEKEDIRFFFQNETVIGILPFHSQALGGISLKVHPDDVEKALLILRDFDDRSQLHIV